MKSRSPPDTVVISVSNLITTFDELGVPRDAVEIHVVLRGSAAAMALNDQAYSRVKDAPRNLHADDLAMLLHAGASVEVCGETMSQRGWTTEDVLPEVEVVPGAIVRLVELQNRGCTYIHF